MLQFFTWLADALTYVIALGENSRYAPPVPNDPESLGTGIGPLLADLIPLMPSGARRAGAARVMAARVGRDPSVLIDQPRITQLLALGLGAVGGAYTQGQSTPVRLAAMAGPIALVQLLRRLELGSIQKSYDTQKRKRLRELDETALLDRPGWFGTNGSTRLGAVSAYETMRDRKYKGYSSLAEAGDALHLAAGGLHPGLALPMSSIVSILDNKEAQGMRDLSKKAEFTDQRNMPAIPLYLAAALASSAGLVGARHVAINEGRNTQPLGTENWAGMIGRVSGTEPMMLATQGNDNAFFYKPRDEREALSFLRNYATGLQDVTPTAGRPQRGEYGKQMDQVNRLMRAGVIVADDTAGAPTVAHEAGHAKIEETPGFLRGLQRHVYPHQGWIAPLAGAGSMAAGLASGSTLGGGLLGTGIGALAGLGHIGPEIGASYHGMKGLSGGAMTTEGKKDLLTALTTYLAFNVLPSTLSGAAGGWISGRRKKKREEQEKQAGEQSVYHGSSVEVGELEPRPSRVIGGESAVFAAPDKEMALSFARNWRDEDFEHGTVDGQKYMREARPGAFEELLRGEGFIHELDGAGFRHDPRLTKSERISSEMTPAKSVERIEDVLEALKASGFLLLPYGTPAPWEQQEKQAAEQLVHYSMDKHPELRALSYDELEKDRQRGRWKGDPEKAKAYVKDRRQFESALHRRLRARGIDSDEAKTFLYATLFGKEKFKNKGMQRHIADLDDATVSQSFFDVVGDGKSRTVYGRAGLQQALKRWEKAEAAGTLKNSEYMGMQIHPRIEVITGQTLRPHTIEKVAAWDPRRMWEVLVKARGMSGNLADEYVKGIFGVHYKPLKSGFSKLPLDVQQAAKLPLPIVAPQQPAAPAQGLLDLFKEGAHPALPMLLEAKRHSDAKRYDIKNRYLRQNMRRDPDAWIVDSDDGKGIVGVTHVPTGFRLHMRKSVVDPDVLKYHNAMIQANHTTKEASRASTVMDELRRLVVSPMKEEGLFGKAVKEKLKGKPVLWHGTRSGEETGFHEVDFMGSLFGGRKADVEKAVDPLLKDDQNILARLYSRFGGMGKIDSLNPTHGRIKDPAAIFDINGTAKEQGAGDGLWEMAGLGRDRVDVTKDLAKQYPGAERIHVAPTTFGGDKLREAQVVPAINETHTLADLFPKGIPRSPEAARAVLEQKLGPNWIVKSREGLASSDTNLTDKALGRDMLDRLRATVTDNGGLGKVIVQRRSEAQEVGPIARWIDELAGGDAGIGMKKKEYRVHVVNGKVVPYATYGRGNVLDYATTLLNPLRTKEVRNVEGAVQKAMDGVKNKSDRFKATYGFDVGVDKTGKPFIVETNPSEGGIASSWFDSPFVADATVAATRGELPKWIKARNAAYGVTAAGAGGVGLGLMDKSGSTNETSAGDILTRLGLGALAADTGYNAVNMGMDASRMEKLHNSGIAAFRNGGLGTADKARLLEGYADNAGAALNRRVAGIPAHLLMRALTPSADASITDRLRDALGKSVRPQAAKAINDSRDHYRVFANNPRLAMLREIMTDDPSAMGMKRPPVSSAAQAVNAAMGNGGASPDLRVLFGPNAVRDKQLVPAVNKRFAEFFLGGQKTQKGFNVGQAKSWGLTPYSKVMKPTALGLGAVSLASLFGALRPASE